MTEEIVFSKDSFHNCWSSTRSDGKMRAHVRQVQDQPHVLTVEVEWLHKDGVWMTLLYDVVDITEIKGLYPDASKKVLKSYFTDIVKTMLKKKMGWP